MAIKSELLKRTLKAIGMGAGIAAGGYGVATAIDYLQQTLPKKGRFNMMLKENPDLRKSPKETVQKMFNIVHRFSPEMTADPIVAGTSVRGMLEFKDIGVAPKTVKELVDISQGLAKIKGEKGRFTGALRALALHPTLGE